jgi:uncharacterized protein YegL
MRKLPVYFLLDSTPGMMQEPMYALNNSLSGLINSLRSYPEAIESISVGIILFNSEPFEILPLTELCLINLPEFINSQGGLLNTGKALEFLIKTSETEIERRKKQVYLYHKPVIFLIISGKPNDPECYDLATNIIAKSEFGYKIGCVISNADVTLLKKFSNTVLKIQYADNESTKQFMMWCKEFILTILNDDQGTFDSEETINPYYPKFPKLTNKLKMV